MSDTKKDGTMKSEKEKLYSVAPTSTEVKIAPEESISESLTQKQKRKEICVGTGRLGYIQFHLALDNQLRHQLGRPLLTEQETADFIEKYMKELPDGLYQITI